MFQHIIIFLISIASVDLFIIIYRAYIKLFTKRINLSERKTVLIEEELTSFNDLYDKKTIIIYGASAIIVSFIVNFLSPNLLEGSFLNKLLNNFIYILFPLLIYQTFKIIFKYIKGFFNFFKGVKESFEIDEDEENTDDELINDEEMDVFEETNLEETDDLQKKNDEKIEEAEFIENNNKE